MRRHIALSLALAGLMTALPASARQPGEPITDRDPNAMDVAKTPITDLNIDKEKIPPVLIAAVDNPYDLDGLKRCSELVGAVEELDAMLGPDIDLPQEERDRISAGRVAKWVVSSFIPFRGLIREVSGANDQEKKVQAAIQAGIARRGFLKGVGATRGCKYPARPAPKSVVQARIEELNGKGKRKGQAKPVERAEADTSSQDQNPQKVAYTAEPVVQQLP